MKYLIFLLVLAACSSENTRLKTTDKSMRVMIDPDSVTDGDYMRVQMELVQSDKFIVVDRGPGYRSVKREQEREHRQDNERFENKAKYAQWGKMYGVGAVILPFTDCRIKQNVFTGRRSKRCHEYLQIIDSNTTEIIASVSADESCSEFDTAEWHDVVEKLVDAYPTRFEEFKKSKRLISYEAESEQIAVKEQEKNERDMSRTK